MSDRLELVLPLGEETEAFQLEKAVCSHPHRQSLLAQVSRMTRLAETEERAVREFRKMCIDGAEEERSFSGCSGLLCCFEDTVKCILLCNCKRDPNSTHFSLSLIGQ